MNKIVLSVVSVGLIVALFIIFSSNAEGTRQNVEIRDGVQYVKINAKGGYQPGITNAQAGIPTKLVMKTNGTYDCSLALVLPSINFQKMLPLSGETEIDLGTPSSGELFKGLCSMGMYNFTINFQ
jgi:uncharacterized protein